MRGPARVHPVCRARAIRTSLAATRPVAKSIAHYGSLYTCTSVPIFDIADFRLWTHLCLTHAQTKSYAKEGIAVILRTLRIRRRGLKEVGQERRPRRKRTPSSSPSFSNLILDYHPLCSCERHAVLICVCALGPAGSGCRPTV